MNRITLLVRAGVFAVFAAISVSCTTTVPSFDELDTDRNDVLSREELSARPRTMFDHFDYDHDGKLTRREYEHPVPIGTYSGGVGSVGGTTRGGM